MCNSFQRSIIIGIIVILFNKICLMSYKTKPAFLNGPLVLVSAPVIRAVRKKRGSMSGRANSVRASQSLNLTRRRASLKAASQILKTLSQRQRSNRKKRY